MLMDVDGCLGGISAWKKKKNKTIVLVQSEGALRFSRQGLNGCGGNGLGMDAEKYVQTCHKAGKHPVWCGGVQKNHVMRLLCP